jgi:hypothetical protein
LEELDDWHGGLEVGPELVNTIIQYLKNKIINYERKFGGNN